MKLVKLFASVVFVVAMASGCVAETPPTTGNYLDAGSFGYFSGDDVTVSAGRFSNHLSPWSPADAGFAVRAQRTNGDSVTLWFGVNSGPTGAVLPGVGTLSGSLLPVGNPYTWFAVSVDGEAPERTYVGTATIEHYVAEPMIYQGQWGGFSENLTEFRATFSIVVNGELVVGSARLG